MTSNPSSRALPSTPLLAALLGLLILAVYWPATTYDFLRWDDQINLTQNPGLHPPSWAHIEIFWHGPYAGLYIPVTYTLWSAMAFFARVSGQQGGTELNPYLFHSLNIFTHFLASLIVWRLLVRLVRNQWAAWFGAAFFALHPTCVEAVAWVTGFRDVLGGMLGFAALLAYFPCERRRDSARYALSTCLFLLAILAKPAAVAILPMALALDLLWIHRRIGLILARLLPWTLAAAALALMTHHIQGSLPAIDTPPWWQRPMIAGDAITFYLGKLFLPIRLCVQYDHSPHRVLARSMAIVPTTIALAVGIIVYLLGRRWRWIWLSGALFLTGLLPVLGFAPFIFQYYSTTADRYLYIALLGASVAIAFILANRPRPALYCAAALFLCVFSALSFEQVLTWRTTQTIFTHVLQINPQSNLAFVKLSWEKLSEGDPQSAEQLARQALAVRSDDVRAWINLGAALDEQHRPEEARQCYLHVIQTDSSRESAGAYSNLAAMQADGGDFAGAISLYQQALNRDPDLPEARIGLSAAQQRSGHLP
jgi:protein O-mannosyl-transferase